MASELFPKLRTFARVRLRLSPPIVYWATSPPLLVSTREYFCRGMKVYTRTGDNGQTSLFNGSRVPKHHQLVEAYGTVDECNAAIGMAVSHLQRERRDDHRCNDQIVLVSRLQAIQHYLFDLGAHLATPRSTSSAAKIGKTVFKSDAAEELETWIDDMDKTLEPLNTFLLPGGHPSAAALHLARTIARRAERTVTPLYLSKPSEIDSSAFQFVNRLSDFLFVASRVANRIMGCSDVKWRRNER